MPSPSRRAARLPPNGIRELTPHAEAAARRGVHVHHLEIGQPDLPTPPQLLDALRRLDLPVVPYGASQGEPALVDALLDQFARLGADLPRASLWITAGASEALSMALAAICDPGDVVLTPDPTYANYVGFATPLDVGLHPLPTYAERAWALPDDLSPHIEAARAATHGARVAAVLVSNPGNPTGAVHDRDALERLLAQARRHDLFVIVDEVYRGLVYGDAATRAAPTALVLDDPDERLVVIDSTSKRFSTCGFRIGALVTRNPALQVVFERLCQTRLSTSVVAQQVVAHIAGLPPRYLEEVRETYRERLEITHAMLAEIPGVAAPMADGAFYQMATLPVRDAADFVRFMLDDFELEGETCMVSPGAGFYLDPSRGRDQVRIACVLEPDAMRRALRCLGGALAAYREAHPDRIN